MSEKMSDVALKHEIRELINENSGGIKFTELITELVSRSMEQHGGFDFDPDDIEKAIEDMDGIEILRYSWHFSTKMSREKMFIYTP